jgi:type IV secretory pathway VirB10-like protein
MMEIPPLNDLEQPAPAPAAPVHQPEAPAARRLSRPAITIVLAVAALLMVTTALLVTAPQEKAIKFAEPKDARPANPAFLNNPPPAPTFPPPTSPEVEALLQAARRSNGRPAPGATAATAQVPPSPQNPQPPDSSDAPGTEPPIGAYRPYYRPTSPQQLQPAPSPWQASFASSLTGGSSSASAPPANLAFPQLTPPPPPATPGKTEAVNDKPSTPPPPPIAPERSTVRPSPSHPTVRTLRSGTVLNLILLTSIQTQVPGDAVAHLTADVYAADGSLVLPKGTRLIGSYQSRVSLGDHRLAVGWDRLVLPGGTSFKIPSLPATSADGAAGVPGNVNNHGLLVFGRAALLSLINAGSQLGQPRQARLGATYTNGEIVAGASTQQLSQVSADYLNRAVDASPTIFIPAGQSLTAILPYDLELSY